MMLQLGDNLAAVFALIAFFVPFLFVAATTPMIRRYALRYKLGDKPNGRKVHTATIPHVGGIGMVVGAFAGIGLIAGLSIGAETATFLGEVMLPVGMIVALGLTDDMKNLRAHQKLTVQIAAALVLASSGFHLLVGLPALDGSFFFIVFFTTFYLVGISSSLNLIDGHDGLAAGVSLIAASSFAALSVVMGANTLLFVSLTIAGACFGFLLYNFPPGRIFMGDTGSMFLGIMLGIIACSITMMKPSINTFFAVCLILALPMLDSWLAIARRLVLRRSVFQADCLHIHHVISRHGLSARQTLMILLTTQTVLAVLGVLTIQGFVFPLVAGLVLLAILFVAFLRMMLTAKQSASEAAAGFTPSSVPSLEK